MISGQIPVFGYLDPISKLGGGASQVTASNSWTPQGVQEFDLDTIYLQIASGPTVKASLLQTPITKPGCHL